MLQPCAHKIPVEMASLDCCSASLQIQLSREQYLDHEQVI